MLAATESLDRNSNLYGKSFEQFICMELRAYLSYRRKKLPLTYWRSKSGHEVDLLIGTPDIYCLIIFSFGFDLVD